MSSRFAVSPSISAFACTIFQSSTVFGPPTWTPFSQAAASNTPFDTGSTVVSMICAMVATGWRSGPREQAASARTATPAATTIGIRSGRAAGRRMPARPIGKLLEVRAREEARRQVLRILHDRRDDEPEVAVVFRAEDVEVLGEHGVRAERNAVLAQVAGADARGDDSQRAAWLRRRTAEHAGAAAELPRRHRFALPRRRRLAAVGGGRAESEDARLRAGLRLDPERRVVVPRDVDAAGDAHDRRGRIRAARFAIGLVALRIPPVRFAAAGGAARCRACGPLPRRLDTDTAAPTGARRARSRWCG